jgi:hypothetical protein
VDNLGSLFLDDFLWHRFGVDSHCRINRQEIQNEILSKVFHYPCAYHTSFNGRFICSIL